REASYVDQTTARRERRPQHSHLDSHREWLHCCLSVARVVAECSPGSKEHSKEELCHPSAFIFSSAPTLVRWFNVSRRHGDVARSSPEENFSSTICPLSRKEKHDRISLFRERERERERERS
ncbi:unnamed protein product, partial [Musa banksii]